jgi:hypothetical protein
MLAVRFDMPVDLVNGSQYLPVEAIEIASAALLPNDGRPWYAMTLPQLNEYVSRARLLAEPINANLTPEQRQVIIAGLKREFGTDLASQCVDLIGARNIILNKSSAQVVSILTNLAPIKTLLETGALTTAVLSIMQLRAAYPDYADIFTLAINEANAFLKANPT